MESRGVTVWRQRRKLGGTVRSHEVERKVSFLASLSIFMHKRVRGCGVYLQAAADPVNLMLQKALKSKCMGSILSFHIHAVTSRPSEVLQKFFRKATFLASLAMLVD